MINRKRAKEREKSRSSFVVEMTVFPYSKSINLPKNTQYIDFSEK